MHPRREEESRSSLEVSRMIEGINRQQLPAQLTRARSEGYLSDKFTDDFMEEIGGTPLEWEITAFGDGIRFERKFPYDTHFYGMKGWDRASLVVNLDPTTQSVALRTHLHDEMGDVTIKEGVLVKEGEVAAFNQELSGGKLYSDVLEGILRRLVTTKGESGCIFDHMRDKLDELPRLVQELSGGKIGQLAKSFLQRIGEGKINMNTMPNLALRWPLPPYYQEEPEITPSGVKRIEDNRLLSADEKKAKIEQIASKDEVSAQELKELVYLIWNTFSQRPSGAHLVLPSRQNVEVSFSLWDPEENTGWITIYNGPNGKTAETIQLSDRKGQPVWRIGIWGKYHSVLLNQDKGVRVPHGDLMASEALSPEECSVVAKALASTYKSASLKPSESLIVPYEKFDRFINN